MNEPSSQILVLGGGVTGMSSALALKDHNLAVHLVEKSDHLGGHAAQWACMATTVCQNCGACLVQEMAAALKSQANARIHTQTTIAKPASEDGTITLSNGETLTPAGIIMATGFTPFDPDTIASYHFQALDGVITTAQLNALIREEKLSATGPAPKIAFLQCVGSRNRKENTDYCSQVCCKVSMRHARKLTHLMPDAKISLFYMDLQLIGKETRTAAQDLAGQVELVQGVPAEILQNPGKQGLTMIVEDPSTCARKARQFDLVVLSVGMTPARNNRQTCEMLGITPNPWGFFNTDDAVSSKNIIVAGCARGPTDILGCRQEGRMAAASLLQKLDPEPADPVTHHNTRPGIAVIGSGPHALDVASAAAAQGYPVYSFGHHRMAPPGIQGFGTAKITSIQGVTGHFTIFYDTQGKKGSLHCGAIIAAPSPSRQNRAIRFPRAATLDTFAETPLKDRPPRTIILLDYFGPENKGFSRLALRESIASCQAGQAVTMLMSHMLVHGPAGQQAYDNARKAGVKFLRFKTPEDVTVNTGSSTNTVSLVLQEATLPGREISLEADCLVVPDTLVPATGFKEIADLLRADLDSEDFLQSPNVRHRLIHTPRRGIFFAGPCHDEIDAPDLAREIQAIMAEIQLGVAPLQAAASIAINEKSCAQCLTCYRVCPHGAVILNEKHRPQIMAQACFSCMACVANCPAYAIEAQGFDNDSLAAKAGKGKTMILACERSGALAAGNPPQGSDLIPIPCACRISTDMLIKPLIKGADRVIVSACHQGNCRSETGSAMARKQVESAAALPGMKEGKLQFLTVAANEPQAFFRMISARQRRTS